MNPSISVEKKVHKIWAEIGHLNIQPMIGKYQYIYTSPKGQISLVELPNYFQNDR